MAADSTDNKRPKPKRTWPQRLTIAAAFLCALASFTAAGALYAGQRVIEDRNLAPAIIDPSTVTTVAPVVDSTAPSDTAEVAPETSPPPTFPAGRTGRPELPDHRCRQQQLRRSRFAASAGVRRPVDPRRTQRHDHDVARQPGNVAGRRAVVPPRPVGHDRRPVEPATHQRRLRAGQPAATDRHDLPELRHPDRPLRAGRLLCLQDVGRRGRRRHRSLRHAGAATRPRASTFPRRAASRSTATTPSPTCDHATSSTRRPTACGTTDGTSDLGRISRQQDFLRRTVSRLLDEGCLRPGRGERADQDAHRSTSSPTRT